MSKDLPESNQPLKSAGRPKASEVEARTRELIDVAGCLFLKHGYTGVSLEAIAREARWVGKMDPQWPKWPPDQVAVAMRQRAGQANAFYLRMQPFPFMSMGPSNLAPVDLRSGQVIEGSYEVIVEDALER